MRAIAKCRNVRYLHMSYVRHSSMPQVQTDLESQRRQYALVQFAQETGFRRIEVVGKDLGRSGGGSQERPEVK